MMLEVDVEKIVQHIFVNRPDLRSNRYVGIDAKRFHDLVLLLFWSGNCDSRKQAKTAVNQPNANDGEKRI